jgi:hypothetical protein
MNRDDGKPTVMDLLAVSDCGYHLETSVLDGYEYGVPQQMVKSENEHEEKQKNLEDSGEGSKHGLFPCLGSVSSMFLEAVPTVYWFPCCWFERNLSLLSTIGTSCFVHFSGTAKISSAHLTTTPPSSYRRECFPALLYRA